MSQSLANCPFSDREVYPPTPPFLSSPICNGLTIEEISLMYAQDSKPSSSIFHVPRGTSTKLIPEGESESTFSSFLDTPTLLDPPHPSPSPSVALTREESDTLGWPVIFPSTTVQYRHVDPDCILSLPPTPTTTPVPSLVPPSPSSSPLRKKYSVDGDTSRPSSSSVLFYRREDQNTTIEATPFSFAGTTFVTKKVRS
jgi:hypothetical protein